LIYFCIQEIEVVVAAGRRSSSIISAGVMGRCTANYQKMLRPI